MFLKGIFHEVDTIIIPILPRRVTCRRSNSWFETGVSDSATPEIAPFWVVPVFAEQQMCTFSFILSLISCFFEGLLCSRRCPRCWWALKRPIHKVGSELHLATPAHLKQGTHLLVQILQRPQPPPGCFLQEAIYTPPGAALHTERERQILKRTEREMQSGQAGNTIKGKKELDEPQYFPHLNLKLVSLLTRNYK